jgi:ribosomal protein S18 acetylase RimI-like enzyme
LLATFVGIVAQLGDELMRLHIVAEANPRAEDIDFLQEAIYEFNRKVTGLWAYVPVHLFLRDEQNNLLGGMLGGIWGGWLHLMFLWVHESVRGEGYGRQLLEAAESTTRAHQCQGVFLETHSFQARPFYEKAGYTVMGEIANYPPGESYYLMKKLF